MQTNAVPALEVGGNFDMMASSVGENGLSLPWALLRPDAYAHPANDIRLHETHSSWVILSGPFAYKVKKPVLAQLRRRGTAGSAVISPQRSAVMDGHDDLIYASEEVSHADECCSRSRSRRKFRHDGLISRRERFELAVGAPAT